MLHDEEQQRVRTTLVNYVEEWKHEGFGDL
jgi:hypothetical protein